MTKVITSFLTNGQNSISVEDARKGKIIAWGNFLGGTGQIRGSFGVSYVARLSIGAYEIGLSSMADNINYSVIVSSGRVAQAGQPVNVISSEVDYNSLTFFPYKFRIGTDYISPGATVTGYNWDAWVVTFIVHSI